MLLVIMLISCGSEPEPQNDEEVSAVPNTNETVTENKTKLGFQTENIPEGILLSFDEIPADATAMYINLYEGEHDGKEWSDVFGIVVGPKLDELKETKKLICPFVKQDTQYSLSAQIVQNDEIAAPYDIIASVQSPNGIFVSNEIVLELNDEQTGVTLSAEPEFSAPVEFNEYKYEYVLLNFINENESLSSGIYSGNELSCTFIPDTINLIKESDPALSGTFPSHVVALCSVKDKGALWQVCVAKTEDFTIEF